MSAVDSGGERSECVVCSGSRKVADYAPYEEGQRNAEPRFVDCHACGDAPADRGGERGVVTVRRFRNFVRMRESGPVDDIRECELGEVADFVQASDYDALAADRDVLANRVAHLEKLRDGRFFVPYEDHQTLAKLRGEDWDARKKAEAERDRLAEALKQARFDYVTLLENARDRILSFGGTCDPVDVMERGDPALRRIDAALSGGRT